MSDLNKSIDSLIDELFAEPVEKSNMIKDQKPQKETADEAVNAAPKSEKDEKRDAGRPKQISEVPQTDTDGNRAGEYDGKIAAEHTDAKKKEDSQVEVPQQMKKSENTLTDEEVAEYRALKKAKKQERKAEDLRKAQTMQVDLIKSAVIEATSGLRKENEDLRKSMEEQGNLIKSMANKPQKSKAVTNVQAVEKFQKSSSGSGNTFSKSELLDVAEDLVKSKQLTVEHVIELENNGFIYDNEARRVLEREINRRS